MTRRPFKVCLGWLGCSLRYTKFVVAWGIGSTRMCGRNFLRRTSLPMANNQKFGTWPHRIWFYLRKQKHKLYGKVFDSIWENLGLMSYSTTVDYLRREKVWPNLNFLKEHIGKSFSFKHLDTSNQQWLSSRASSSDH